MGLCKVVGHYFFKNIFYFFLAFKELRLDATCSRFLQHDFVPNGFHWLKFNLVML